MSSPSSPPREDTVAVVGVGLIGGSLAGAVRQRGLARRVIGVGRDPQRLAAAQQAGLLDEFTCDLHAAAAESSLMVFCTPVDKIAAQAQQAFATARPGTLFTDAGSVKGPICSDLAAWATGPKVFLGAHPLAGSERAGFEHADPQLFEDRMCVITPLPAHAEQDIARLTRFWQQLGMQTVRMSPADHDAAVACTSHVPHVVAAALAATLRDDQRPLTATGFRDTTRVAAGDPDLWTAILLQNARSVTDGLQAVDAELAAFRTAIERSDPAALKTLLETAKTKRDALTDISRR
jgi:prephenate dehydrogenase